MNIAIKNYQTRKREERKAAGVCTICGKAPAVDGLTYCQECREKEAERYKMQKRSERAQLIASKWPAGWCCVCGGEAPKGKKYCDAHKPKKEEWE